MDSDGDDYVFYGTPIEREEEISSRKKKAVAESSGHLRSLPVWKQEVTDEEGRRRFHGAFTGGFSAGYYNTVGSEKGWAPQSFVSSRKHRAEVKQQSILNFLDEDEKAELDGQSLGTSMQFDTFGFTAAELARKQAEKEQQQRPSAIPGPVPDEIILPVTESIGVKLLLKMGWRHGHSIKDSNANSQYDARREARKAFLAFSSDDSKAESEPVKGNIESSTDRPANDDVLSYKSTPMVTLKFVLQLNKRSDLSLLQVYLLSCWFRHCLYIGIMLYPHRKTTDGVHFPAGMARLRGLHILGPVTSPLRLLRTVGRRTINQAHTHPMTLPSSPTFAA